MYILNSIWFSLLCITGVSACIASYGNIVPLNPDPVAPESYSIQFNTNLGSDPIIISVNRSWAPIGADHLYWIVKDGFYDCSVSLYIIMIIVDKSSLTLGVLSSSSGLCGTIWHCWCTRRNSQME